MKIKMRYSYLLFVFFAFFYSVNAFAFPADTSVKVKIKYSKKELKKELKDIKTVDAQFKDWNRAVKQKNPDYLNIVFKKTIKLLEKEHAELNNRISERSKKLLPPASTNPSTNPAAGEDKPKVYNAELKDQVVRVSKEEILQKKAESETLSNYINVIRNEKIILNKLASIKEFDAETKPENYVSVSNEFAAFKIEMLAEIALLKKETGKK
ncbi:MAG: hypothetical protein IPO78_02545 [Saprospiraceae bacterium]|nr:hypothetical protein [Saprospiraceae bacterium]MBK9727450.1 hypothetical protein [Saprospiraceae bacterium]